MDVSALLLDLYGRVPPLVREAVDGLDGDDLTWQPAPDANTIAWLVWHLARVQDHHVSELIDAEQLWVEQDWGPRFGLASDPRNHGYGNSGDDVRAVRPDGAQALIDYFAAADARTRALLVGVTDAELDRIVDRRWDPPVSMGVRLVSVADDCLQHVGQANYVRGLLASRPR
jgi:hypothetical protein